MLLIKNIDLEKKKKSIVQKDFCEIYSLVLFQSSLISFLSKSD